MPPFPMPRTPLLVVAIAALSVVPGCKPANEVIAGTATRQADGVPVDIGRDDEGIDTGIDAGSVKAAAGTVALPADFPGDVFLPAQRTVSSALDMSGMKAVNIATTGTLAQVSADVEKAMQAQGWKREMSMQTRAGSATLIYAKDKRQVVYQLVIADDGGILLAVRTGEG